MANEDTHTEKRIEIVDSPRPESEDEDRVMLAALRAALEDCANILELSGSTSLTSVPASLAERLEIDAQAIQDLKDQKAEISSREQRESFNYENGVFVAHEDIYSLIASVDSRLTNLERLVERLHTAVENNSDCHFDEEFRVIYEFKTGARLISNSIDSFDDVVSRVEESRDESDVSKVHVEHRYVTEWVECDIESPKEYSPDYCLETMKGIARSRELLSTIKYYKEIGRLQLKQCHIDSIEQIIDVAESCIKEQG